MGARVWSVFDRRGRLVFALSDEPGEVVLTEPPAEDLEVVECAFASLRCFDARAENEVLGLLVEAASLEPFLDALRKRRYRVVEGRPRPGTFARL